MTEGTVTTWFQADGAVVRQGEPLYQLETDKVNLTVDAPESGTLQRVVAEGETVPVGAVVAHLTPAAASPPAVSPPMVGVSSAPAESAATSRSTTTSGVAVTVTETPDDD